MTRAYLLVLPLVLTSSACSSGDDAATVGTDSPSGSGEGRPSANDPMSALHDNIAATAAREEHTAETVKVAHILVAFQGAQRSTASRSKEAAEALAADLLARIQAGEDFMELMQANSDDPGGGVYGMTTGARQQGYFPRGQMAGAFGDTGWRLGVDEVGVAAFDAQKSPFGWHIIKRVE